MATRATRTHLPDKLPVQYRSLEIRREWINEKARTVEFSFSSNTPIERWFGFEILSHDPGAIDTERILKGGALLENHDWESQIGVIEKVWIEKNERAWCRSRFSKNPHPEEVWRDVLDEVKRNISVGYIIDEYEMVENEDEAADENDLPTILVTRWEPHEISIVSVPADFSVGMGRDQAENGQLYAVRMKAGTQPSRKRQSRIMATRAQNNNEPAPANGNGDPPAEPTIEVVREQTRKDESKRVREMLAMGARFNCQAEAQQYIDQERSLADFQHFILTERLNAQPVANNQDLGLSRRDMRQYSIVKAIRELSDINAGPRLTGLEAESSAAMAKVLKREPQGFFLPPEIIRGPSPLQTREVTSTIPPSPPGAGGGNLVPSELLLPMIDLLRVRMQVMQAGATMLPGLSGNIAYPKQTGGATSYWLSEIASVTPSEQAFGQVPLTPKRLSSMTEYSRQLVIQSSPDIEAIIRSDLMITQATMLDRTALFGTGVPPEPRGIINQVGINRWDFGTDPLFEGYVAAVVSIDDSRVSLLTPAWIANPVCWGAGISTPKFPNTGITVIESGGAGLGTCLGYRYLTTHQIPNTGANEGLVFFGNWQDLLIGQWDGTDIIVDPYTRAHQAVIRIVVLQFYDINVRYPEAFAVSRDPAYPPDVPFKRSVKNGSEKAGNANQGAPKAK
jgi:HK97 family phage major capsid protein